MQVCIPSNSGVCIKFSTGDMTETPERLKFHNITGQGWNKQIPDIQRGTFSAKRDVYIHIPSLSKLGTEKNIKKKR